MKAAAEKEMREAIERDKLSGSIFIDMRYFAYRMRRELSRYSA